MYESELPGSIPMRAYPKTEATGKPSRVIWLVSGLDDAYSAITTARYLNSTHKAVHLVWDPETGAIVQMMPAGTTGPYRGIPKDCLDGSITVMATARQGKPFTATPLVGLDRLMKFIRGHEIPDVFPFGPPGHQSRIGSEPGHYAYETGPIDVDRILRS
ncbi:hypothetical protein [Herbidospora cretacea]|uniref:hypothetical protein n=1 Tax=Herbidospora cretacea TaxID=28444 RepID=UPI0012FC6839|nr:hypothetical protein [Herbidospora cretacea]